MKHSPLFLNVDISVLAILDGVLIIVAKHRLEATSNRAIEISIQLDSWILGTVDSSSNLLACLLDLRWVSSP